MSSHEGGDFAVSTIIEDMFEYFDAELLDKHKRYRKLYGELRLRAALTVFFEEGLAELAPARKPLPMWVPTKVLMGGLKTSRLTRRQNPCSCLAL